VTLNTYLLGPDCHEVDADLRYENTSLAA